MTTSSSDSFANLTPAEVQARTSVKAWRRNLAEGFKPTAADHLIYNLLRQKPAGNGFTPITNKVKLANGQTPNQALALAQRFMLGMTGEGGRQRAVSLFDLPEDFPFHVLRDKG